MIRSAGAASLRPLVARPARVTGGAGGIHSRQLAQKGTRAYVPDDRAPIVMLALRDDARRDELVASLEHHPLGLRVEGFASAEALIARVLGEGDQPTLLLVGHELDEQAGTATLTALRNDQGWLPRSVLLFTDADDPGRTRAAEFGVIDFVMSTSAGLDPPLMSLVGRLITRDVLESRLDATTVQFRALVESSNDGIYILQQGDKVAYVNPRFEQMVGYNTDEMLRPGFSIFKEIISPESRPILEDRLRRIRAGESVPPRYEFVARHRSGEQFDAQVSVSYITFRGEPATLGIMQDITERKRHEKAMRRKNRELALQSDLAASINEAIDLEELLKVGCHRLHQLLEVGATGICLLSEDGSRLVLQACEGLDDELEALLKNIPTNETTLIGKAVSTREVQIVTDLGNDARVAFPQVQALGFEGAMVVPVGSAHRTLGAAFLFTRPERPPSVEDRELMIAIGNLLGTAIQKASLLAQERASVRSLTALDEIALAVASRLEAVEIAETVARSVQRIYGARRVVIAQLSEGADHLEPLCVLDNGHRDEGAPLFPKEDSLLGEALTKRAVVMRVRGMGDGPIYTYTRAMFEQGIGTAVAIPVISDGELGGGLLLGYEKAAPLEDVALAALGSLAPHVAVALKNAHLFEARRQALDDLKAAQDKLVQSEKLRALGELAAGVAHDFNNVLGAILGRAQLLKTQLRDPALLKHAEIIEKAANDGAETVRRIQEIGRQETTDDFVQVSLREILHDVVELTVPRWRDRPNDEGRPIEMIEDPGERDVMVMGNPHELREVLINLVHNAVDAMPAGGKLTLTVSSALAGGERYGMLAVKDSGTGIPAEVRERIFDPFFTTKGERGTGLGLSVSYSIIQRHGGDIEVSSTLSGPERGTTFLIALPELETATLDETASSRQETIDEEAPPPQEDTFEVDPTGLPRILVIDDEENIRDILTDILETGGYEVVSAADGPEGLSMLEKVRIDLVFTDLGLPGMSGYEVAAQVKQRFPKLPVGLVTGWGATLDAAEIRRRGIDLVLSKPFKFEQVLALVQEAMAARA